MTYGYLNNLGWLSTDFQDSGAAIVQYWGLTDMKTGNVYMDALR